MTPPPYGPNYLPGKWCVDKYIWSEEVRSGFDLPRHVHVRDTTMREGAEQPGVSISADQKLQLIEKAAAAGIREFDTGFPGVNTEHADVVKAVKARFPECAVSGWVPAWAPNWKDNVDRAIEVGTDIIDTFQHPILDWANDDQLKLWNISNDQAVPRILEIVDYVTSQGGRVAVTVANCLRTDWSLLEQTYTAAVRAGAERILIAEDGSGSPAGLRYLVSKVRTIVDVPIMIHAHNDFGLGTANNLAAVEAGASVLDLSMNGMGEKAGHSSLEETVVALEVFYGVDTGIDLEQFWSYSQLVQEITGFVVTPTKPLVGENAFRHGRESHVRSVLQGLPQAANEALDPHTIGAERVVLFDKVTLEGDTVPLRLESLGLSYDDGSLQQLRQRLHERLDGRDFLTLAELDNEALSTLRHGQEATA